MVKYSRYQKRKKIKSKYGKLYKMIKTVAKKNKPELKCVDRVTYFADNSFIYANSNWAWVNINGCAQGTTFENRLGIQVVGKSIQIKGLLRQGSTQTQVNDVKVMIIQDKMGNGTAPTTTDVLKFDSFYSPQSLDIQPKRYKFLDVKTYTIMPDATGDSVKQVDLYVKLPRQRIYYTGNSNAFTDTRKNSIWVGFCAAKTETTNSNYPRFNFMSRFRFFDE